MNGWGRNSSHGKLLREAVNACKMAWESCVLSSCMQHGERVLKAVGQPSHQTQVCRTAFSVAQHSSSRCSAGEVPGNSVTQYTPGRNAFQDQEQARGSVSFSKHSPWEILERSRAALPNLPLCPAHHIPAPL